MAWRIPVEELLHRMMISGLRDYVSGREAYLDPPNFPRDEIIAALDPDHAPASQGDLSWWAIGEILVTGWPDLKDQFGETEELYRQFLIPQLLVELAALFNTIESESVRQSGDFAVAFADLVHGKADYAQVREDFPDEIVRRDSKVLVMAANFHRLKMLSPTTSTYTGPPAMRIATVVIALLSGRTFEEARTEFVVPVTSSMGKFLKV